MKLEIGNQHFIKIDNVTYIATRVKNDINGNPRYHVVAVYEDYAASTKRSVQSYNIVEAIKAHHEATYKGE
jgi:hypothetical protein